MANKAASTEKKFEEVFVCDPTKKNHGYKSWDDFFTRKLRENARPIASPEDDNIIANACESKPFCVQHDVKLRDKFWIKGQPYSVIDMLFHDSLAEQFVGGTIYQAFLSALSYHRWHSPISGKIVKKFIAPGAYFSEPQFEDFTENHGADKHAQTPSQGYLSAVATRAIMFIEADNPAIGLMAMIAIGMTEVSTCEMTIEEGQHVKKGDQLGMVSLRMRKSFLSPCLSDANLCSSTLAAARTVSCLGRVSRSVDFPSLASSTMCPSEVSLLLCSARGRFVHRSSLLL